MMGRVCIIGVGLIGGSLARALHRAGIVDEVVGVGRDAANLKQALALGVIDRSCLDPAKGVQGADLVVLAVPVGAMHDVLARIAPALGAHTIVTDVGSTKGSVVAAARQVFGTLPARFVPGHPIAGAERSGVAASFADLFDTRRVILTPIDGETDPVALAQVRDMWLACGATVSEMAVSHHDTVLAETSHLPHLLAYTLVDTLARMDDSAEIFTYAAGGFRDFTRIASSDPQMWQDICLANREALLRVLERYQGELKGLAEAIRDGDAVDLRRRFSRAKQARDNFCGDTDSQGESQCNESPRNKPRHGESPE